MNEQNGFWATAFETHYHPLCRLVCTRLTDGDVAEAEDVSSETFMRAMRYVKYPETITHLLAYLFVTARRVFVMKRHRENQQNMVNLEALVEAGHEPSVESDVYRLLETKEFEAAYKLKRGPLAPREKTLLELHLEGYTCHEIASMLDEDERVTRSDLNNVRAKVYYRLTKASK